MAKFCIFCQAFSECMIYYINKTVFQKFKNTCDLSCIFYWYSLVTITIHASIYLFNGFEKLLKKCRSYPPGSMNKTQIRFQFNISEILYIVRNTRQTPRIAKFSDRLAQFEPIPYLCSPNFKIKNYQYGVCYQRESRTSER